MKKKSLIEDIRREQVIESAINSIATHGYAKSSLEQIAEMAEFSRGVITYYFKSKDMLLSAVLDKIMRNTKDGILPRVESVGTPQEKLREFISASFDHMKENRKQYESLIELWSNLEYKKTANKKLYDVCRKIVFDIIESGMQKGVFKEVDAMAASTIIHASIDGIMIQWVFDEKSVDLNEIRDYLTTIIFSFLEKR